MNKFSLIILLASSLVEGRTVERPELDGRIVGGRDVDIRDFPYQLSMINYGEHICGASIINSRWALTAAHCVDGMRASEISFRSGSTYSGKGGTVHPAERIIVHPRYDGDWDFALVKIKNSFPINTPGVSAVKLASTPPPTAQQCVVSGWGTVSFGGGLPPTLKAVDVPIISREKCNRAYDGKITGSMICAGFDRGEKDACQGDSGGPLINKATGEQVGVVSWGYGCADPLYPGVYANVASALGWIKTNSQL